MPIDTIFASLRASVENLSIRRLQVSQPGDDDNLWFIGVVGRPDEVQIECRPGGWPPFLLEGLDDRVLSTSRTDEAVTTISSWLRTIG